MVHPVLIFNFEHTLNMLKDGIHPFRAINLQVFMTAQLPASIDQIGQIDKMIGMPVRNDNCLQLIQW